MQRILQGIVAGLRYVKSHPQLLFALMLLIVVPLLFLYSGQQFLEAGKANQERLQKDRVGMMHDSLATLMVATDFATDTARTQIEKLAVLNTDIRGYTIAHTSGDDIMVIISDDVALEGKPVVNEKLFLNASLETNASLIFEFINGASGRAWSAYRAIRDTQGGFYFIQTTISLESVDSAIAARERQAYFTLAFIYLFLLLLAYWHIKLTDYQYLYTEATEAIATKDLFTNMIAHELRAPLTAIRGYASILKSHVPNAAEQEQAGRIEDSAERLILIVNDLLDVARIQSGNLAMEIATTALLPVVTDVVTEMRVVATEKGSEILIESSGASYDASVDAHRLQQVLTNIISNAIKYTEKGKIVVVLDETRKNVVVRVQDTGMGISSEDQKKLFAPFFRVTNENMSTITGTGLGMWITKQLVELMGGTIGVESIKGVGTHVVVTLPKQKQQTV